MLFLHCVHMGGGQKINWNGMSIVSDTKVDSCEMFNFECCINKTKKILA